MYRPLVAVLLAALIAVSGAGLVAAGEPAPTPTGEPAPSGSMEPAIEPTIEPTAPPTDEPTSSTDPAATGEPTSSPEATPTPTGPGEPTQTEEPAPTEEPTPPTDPAPPVDRPDGAPDPSGRYIVVLDRDADTTAAVQRHRSRNGVSATARFNTSFRGYAARLTQQQRRAILTDTTVAAVVPDELIELTAQTTPTGVSRVGARHSTVAAINGTDQRVDADIAIVDTGIALHPDLNVAGGVNCTSSDRTNWHDWNGHGTHVAGTVAALDNDFGVVGVAPGARLWAVRILNSEGYGLLSWYICGLDWILAQRDPNDATRPLIEGVNMSVAKRGSDDLDCGYTNSDVLHRAICRLVAGGITVVAAAANESTSAAAFVPAAYNEVITVSALADSDGQPGGLGGNRCYSWGTYDKDDTFADFSNYGSDVDIIAPGKCIWSTVPGPSYGYSSGTSMAAPAVTGAVALYKASRPMATPADVREALRYLGNQGWSTTTDPDPYHEPLLDVSRVGSLGTFRPEVTAPVPVVSEKGATFTLPVTIRHSSTFFERVRLTLADVPAGWTASYSSAWLYGWDATSSTIRVTVPQSTRPGTYTIRLLGTNYGRVREGTLAVTVEGDAPTAKAPSVTTTTGVSVTGPTGSLALTTRVSWPAATDPTSPIGGYELQRSTDGTTWIPVATTSASLRSVVVRGLPLGPEHRFRVRAVDILGNWSPWVSDTYRLSAVGDRSTAVAYRGTWSRTTSTPATDGTIRSSTQAGASARYQFTGRGIAVIAPTSATRGKVTVLIDGVSAGTIDLRTSTTIHRRIVFSRTWTTSGTHSIELRVQGTSGRPTVSLDGFVVVR